MATEMMDYQSERRFRNEIKAGDKAFIWRSMHGLSKLIEAIATRVTKTQVVLKELSTNQERRFSKSTGVEYGSSNDWRPYRFIPPQLAEHFRKGEERKELASKAKRDKNLFCSELAAELDKLEPELMAEIVRQLRTLYLETRIERKPCPYCGKTIEFQPSALAERITHTRSRSSLIARATHEHILSGACIRQATKRDCRVCGGEGWLRSLPEGQSECPACKGSGKEEVVR